MGSVIAETGGENASRWKSVSASCTAPVVSGSVSSSTPPSPPASFVASAAGIEKGRIMQFP